jgi:hypothetical protein
MALSIRREGQRADESRLTPVHVPAFGDIETGIDVAQIERQLPPTRGDTGVPIAPVVFS